VRTSADDAARQILGPRARQATAAARPDARFIDWMLRLFPVSYPRCFRALRDAAARSRTVSAASAPRQLLMLITALMARASASPWCSRSSRPWAARWRWPRCRSPRSSPYRRWYLPSHRRYWGRLSDRVGRKPVIIIGPDRLHRGHGAVHLRVPRRPDRAAAQRPGPVRRGARRRAAASRDHVGDQPRDHGLCGGPDHAAERTAAMAKAGHGQQPGHDPRPRRQRRPGDLRAACPLYFAGALAAAAACSCGATCPPCPAAQRAVSRLPDACATSIRASGATCSRPSRCSPASRRSSRPWGSSCRTSST
jgi:hypothetical protein